MKITEHEMRGLLAGKCVPADMLVNETLSSYLVRKFFESEDTLRIKRNHITLRDGYIAELEGDNEELKDELSALQQKLDAANAERERLAVQCAAAKIAVQAAQAAGFECTLNTPAVDAYMNAVRAEGVDMAANFLIKADTVGSTGAMGHALHSLSLELRAETDTTSSQYESLNTRCAAY